VTRARRGGKRAATSIEWTERALADLQRIEDYIAADDPLAAGRWVGRLIARAEAAASMPLAGRVIPERARQNVREVFVRTYRIVYRVREAGILVLTVFEGHRMFPSDLDLDE
jgi:toxin ParE1/3/4